MLSADSSPTSVQRPEHLIRCLPAWYQDNVVKYGEARHILGVDLTDDHFNPLRVSLLREVLILEPEPVPALVDVNGGDHGVDVLRLVELVVGKPFTEHVEKYCGLSTELVVVDE